jgi:hypothetical protein
LLTVEVDFAAPFITASLLRTEDDRIGIERRFCFFFSASTLEELELNSELNLNFPILTRLAARLRN